MSRPGGRPVRVLRVIARLNMGGPAQHVGLLSGDRMAQQGYETLLVHGQLGRGEQSMQYFAEREGATLRFLPRLAQPVDPLADASTVAALARMIRKARPDIIHTHTAKAGFVGRLAALSIRPRPIIVHTYHGHVLSGYFGAAKTEVYMRLERTAGRVSDALIGVSSATVNDLIALRVAPADAFRVIPLGLPLERFAALDPVPNEACRRGFGAHPGELLLSYVGRIVPIKRVDLLITAIAEAHRRGTRVRLLIVGDGEMRPELEGLAGRLGVADVISFLGYRIDLDRVLAAADAAVLSSDNEGTAVSLIEAAAASRPAVATDVGGVRDIVTVDTGLVVAPGDPGAIAAAIQTLAEDDDLRLRLGRAARKHALARFSADRLIGDVDSLYRELLLTRRKEPDGCAG